MKKVILTMIVLLVSAICGHVCAQTKQTKSMVKNGKKVLVAYYSRTGENYAVGVIKKGNTHIIAEMIAGETGGTLFSIDPVKAYPDDYTECTQVAKQEKNQNARPAIKKDIAVEDYDVIFIGYPNWWGDMPMVVYTFLEGHNWNGKIVIPFCTHEGSGLSNTVKYVANTCKGATTLKGLAVRGATAQNSQSEAKTSVKKWLEDLNY